MNDLEKLKESYDAVTKIVENDTKQFSQEKLAPLYTALAIAQGEFKAPVRTKTAKIKGRTNSGSEYSYEYKYAPLDEIINAVKEPLARNGLSHTQFLLEPRYNVMRTRICHNSGVHIESDYPIFAARDGGQAFAAGCTYASRYGLSLALGLAPEDDDDNVETPASGSPRIADQPVPNSRPQHPTPLTESESEGTGDISYWKDLLACSAEQGMEALRRRWADVPASFKKNLMPELTERLKPRAAEVDAK